MLLPYDEIPKWLQDNSYIHHGYRPESKSTRACFASWLYLHNETVNIFSHLILSPSSPQSRCLTIPKTILHTAKASIGPRHEHDRHTTRDTTVAHKAEQPLGFLQAVADSEASLTYLRSISTAMASKISSQAPPKPMERYQYQPSSHLC